MLRRDLRADAVAAVSFSSVTSMTAAGPISRESIDFVEGDIARRSGLRQAGIRRRDHVAGRVDMGAAMLVEGQEGGVVGPAKAMQRLDLGWLRRVPVVDFALKRYVCRPVPGKVLGQRNREIDYLVASDDSSQILRIEEIGRHAGYLLGRAGAAYTGAGTPFGSQDVTLDSLPSPSLIVPRDFVSSAPGFDLEHSVRVWTFSSRSARTFSSSAATRMIPGALP